MFCKIVQTAFFTKSLFGEQKASLKTATLEDILSIRRTHPLSEPVHTIMSSIVRLIGSLHWFRISLLTETVAYYSTYDGSEASENRKKVGGSPFSFRSSVGFSEKATNPFNFTSEIGLPLDSLPLFCV